MKIPLKKCVKYRFGGYYSLALLTVVRINCVKTPHLQEEKRVLCGWIINPSPLWIFTFQIYSLYLVFFFASNSIVKFPPHLNSFVYHICIVPCVLACSGLQRSPWTSGGLPALRGDGVDSWGVCWRSGRPHPAAGCRHHHHQKRVNDWCWWLLSPTHESLSHHISHVVFPSIICFWAVHWFTFYTCWNFWKITLVWRWLQEDAGPTALHCFHPLMVHQGDQTTLDGRVYLRVYLIKGGCKSISHLITHTKQRSDP